MSTAEHVKDLTIGTLETFDLARERAEELLSSGSATVNETFEVARGRAEELLAAGSATVGEAVAELRERKPDVDLPLPDLQNNRLRTTLIVGAVLGLIVLVLYRRRQADDTTPVASPESSALNN